MDISAIRDQALAFRERLGRVKRSTDLSDLADAGWYPFDTLNCFSILDRFLRGPQRELLSLSGGEPMLDLGCGDGDLSFFLESMIPAGPAIHTMDFPASNHNGMGGVYRLREVLESRIQIEPVNLDSQFVLPQARYGLTFFLGVLYHLKNPIYVLEQLAEHSRYCVFSTKISNDAGSTAKLLDTPEDETNFWEFSRIGLERLLKRCGWTVVQFELVTDSKDGHPNGRFYALLKSYWADEDPVYALGEGWHATEHQAWRWTGRTFAATLRRAAGSTTVDLRFHLPEAIVAALGAVTLTAYAGGRKLGSAMFGEAGEHVLSLPLPSGNAGEVEVRWELDKAYPPSASDPRELGVQVCFARGEGEAAPMRVH
ncbi:hypothetical protein F183_A14150 [Bryobacterales bacterium F-183]|nr:hypothetical protein F183_A14150 [Bryobacterales bacterium F-183]